MKFRKSFLFVKLFVSALDRGSPDVGGDVPTSAVLSPVPPPGYGWGSFDLATEPSQPLTQLRHRLITDDHRLIGEHIGTGLLTGFPAVYGTGYARDVF